MQHLWWAALPLVLLTGCPRSTTADDDDDDDDDDDVGADGDGDTDADGDSDGLDAGPDAPALRDGGIGLLLGSFTLSLPALVYEPNYPGSPSATLHSCDGEAIKIVTPAFAEELTGVRRGYLEDGRVIQEDGNLGGGGPCYAVMDPQNSPWGQGSYARGLEPFLSVFMDPAESPDGRWLYVPELYRASMPGAERGLSFVHDGCVRVDDAGGAGQSVGLWAVFPAYADELRRLLGTDVELYHGSDYCPESN